MSADKFSTQSSFQEINSSSIKENIRFDVVSALVVFLVALPLCLGIALASEAPPFSGILAGIIGGIVVGFFSGSPLSVSGPAAGLTSIVAASIAQLGSFEAFLVAVVLAGIFQVFLGILRAGIIGYYFPTSVIKGMLAAIGLILILKQIPHALGYDLINEGNIEFNQTDGSNTFTEPYYAFKDLVYGSPSSKIALLLTLISLAILIVWEKPFLKKYTFFKVVPGPLVVVLVGILLNSSFEYFGTRGLSGIHLVQLPVFDSLKEAGDYFMFPAFFSDISILLNKDIYVIGITIALVASIESLLSVEAVDKLDPYKRATPTNRELIAQGMGNIASGMIGGLPVTAVIVRSSANVASGGRTKMSAILHGVMLALCVFLIPMYLNLIPKACLGGILLVVGYKLAKISLFKSMFKMGWGQFLPFIITIVAILTSDLLKGVGIGLAVGLFFILRNNFRSPIYHYEKEGYEGEDKDDGKRQKINITLSEDVSFLNKAAIRTTLERLPSNSDVTIDGKRTLHIDDDVLDILQDFQQNASFKNINLEFKGIAYFDKKKGEESQDLLD